MRVLAPGDKDKTGLQWGIQPRGGEKRRDNGRQRTVGQVREVEGVDDVYYGQQGIHHAHDEKHYQVDLLVLGVLWQ